MTRFECHTETSAPDAAKPMLKKSVADGDKQLDALREFTLAVVCNRGQVNDELPAFQDAGYTKQQVLEVILFVSQKVMSNYTNPIVETPLDKPFEKFAWQQAQP